MVINIEISFGKISKLGICHLKIFVSDFIPISYFFFIFFRIWRSVIASTTLLVTIVKCASPFSMTSHGAWGTAPTLIYAKVGELTVLLPLYLASNAEARFVQCIRMQRFLKTI